MVSAVIGSFIFCIGILVRRALDTGASLMQKNHAASPLANMSMCGYEATPQEYKVMKKRKTKFVNCKKCKRLLK